MEQNLKADKTLGENIRKWRNVKSMTQEQLSAQLQVRGCDISRGTLAKIEAGIRHVSIKEISTIRTVLDVSYEDLLP
jgi:transcriptional regulator with XRE-family HTH domain